MLCKTVCPIALLSNVELIRTGRRAPNWSADRVMKQMPEFMNVSPDDPNPIFFTGEMVKHGFLVGPYIVC